MDAKLVELVDKIGPLNNQIRSETNPVKKIELMWEVGEYLDKFIKSNNYKLHPLLKELYDPHSTYKNTNITRDLGSYCYRFYKFFKTKNEIKVKLNGLRNYRVFYKAFPLLSNPNYKLDNSQKGEIYKLINRNGSLGKTREILSRKKKSIINISRKSRRKDFENEKSTLLNISKIVDSGIAKNETSFTILKKLHYNLSDITNFVYCLMNLAYESTNKSEQPNWKFESRELMFLFKISYGTTEDKARFRKWGLGTNELLKLAEKLQCVINNDMKYLRNKYYQNKNLEWSSTP